MSGAYSTRVSGSIPPRVAGPVTGELVVTLKSLNSTADDPSHRASSAKRTATKRGTTAYCANVYWWGDARDTVATVSLEPSRSDLPDLKSLQTGAEALSSEQLRSLSIYTIQTDPPHAAAYLRDAATATIVVRARTGPAQGGHGKPAAGQAARRSGKREPSPAQDSTAVAVGRLPLPPTLLDDGSSSVLLSVPLYSLPARTPPEVWSARKGAPAWPTQPTALGPLWGTCQLEVAAHMRPAALLCEWSPPSIAPIPPELPCLPLDGQAAQQAEEAEEAEEGGQGEGPASPVNQSILTLPPSSSLMDVTQPLPHSHSIGGGLGGVLDSTLTTSALQKEGDEEDEEEGGGREEASPTPSLPVFGSTMDITQPVPAPVPVPLPIRTGSGGVPDIWAERSTMAQAQGQGQEGQRGAGSTTGDSWLSGIPRPEPPLPLPLPLDTLLAQSTAVLAQIDAALGTTTSSTLPGQGRMVYPTDVRARTAARVEASLAAATDVLYRGDMTLAGQGQGQGEGQGEGQAQGSDKLWATPSASTGPRPPPVTTAVDEAYTSLLHSLHALTVPVQEVAVGGSSTDRKSVV